MVWVYGLSAVIVIELRKSDRLRRMRGKTNLQKPILHAIVLDFSAVSHIDTTAVQALIDTRAEVEKWADHPVEFHFAPILSPWIRRALVAGGFGIGIPNSEVTPDIASVVPYPYRDGRLSSAQSSGDDLESTGDGKKRPSGTVGLEPVVALDTPFFHVDLGAAVRAAESAVRRGSPLI